MRYLLILLALPLGCADVDTTSDERKASHLQAGEYNANASDDNDSTSESMARPKDDLIHPLTALVCENSNVKCGINNIVILTAEKPSCYQGYYAECHNNDEVLVLFKNWGEQECVDSNGLQILAKAAEQFCSDKFASNSVYKNLSGPMKTPYPLSGWQGHLLELDRQR